jgi:hypothetical protein
MLIVALVSAITAISCGKKSAGDVAFVFSAIVRTRFFPRSVIIFTGITEISFSSASTIVRIVFFVVKLLQNRSFRWLSQITPSTLKRRNVSSNRCRALNSIVYYLRLLTLGMLLSSRRIQRNRLGNILLMTA